MTAHITIRQATPDDCQHVADMSNALHIEMGYKTPAPHTADSIHDIMFGSHTLVKSLIAWRGEIAVGQTVFQPFYNPDHSKMGIWMTELYVSPDMRSEMVGHKLMSATGTYTTEHGYVSLWWSVLEDNRGARRFYERLGAHNSGSLQYEIEGEALIRLAD